jgi:hypothetical protein
MVMGFNALILTDQALEAFFALLCQCHSTQADYEIDADAKLTADDVQQLIEQSERFIQLAESILL